MKSGILLAYFLSLFVVVPAMAVDANDCVAGSAHLGVPERNAYMKSCLDQVSSPDNVKKSELQQKRALCEQNAKNHKLQGNDKANYLETCMNKNEAEAAVKGITPNATVKAEDNQEKTKKKVTKPATAKDRADTKAKPKTKSQSKVKAKAVPGNNRETVQ